MHVKIEMIKPTTEPNYIDKSTADSLVIAQYMAEYDLTEDNARKQFKSITDHAYLKLLKKHLLLETKKSMPDSEVDFTLKFISDLEADKLGKNELESAQTNLVKSIDSLHHMALNSPFSGEDVPLVAAITTAVCDLHEMMRNEIQGKAIGFEEE